MLSLRSLSSQKIEREKSYDLAGVGGAFSPAWVTAGKWAWVTSFARLSHVSGEADMVGTPKYRWESRRNGTSVTCIT